MSRAGSSSDPAPDAGLGSIGGLLLQGIFTDPKLIYSSMVSVNAGFVEASLRAAVGLNSMHTHTLLNAGIVKPNNA